MYEWMVCGFGVSLMMAGFTAVVSERWASSRAEFTMSWFGDERLLRMSLAGMWPVAS